MSEHQAPHSALHGSSPPVLCLERLPLTYPVYEPYRY